MILSQTLLCCMRVSEIAHCGPLRMQLAYSSAQATACLLLASACLRMYVVSDLQSKSTGRKCTCAPDPLSGVCICFHLKCRSQCEDDYRSVVSVMGNDNSRGISGQTETLQGHPASACCDRGSHVRIQDPARRRPACFHVIQYHAASILQ
jgi:hypothetical protein